MRGATTAAGEARAVGGPNLASLDASPTLMLLLGSVARGVVTVGSRLPRTLGPMAWDCQGRPAASWRAKASSTSPLLGAVKGTPGTGTALREPRPTMFGAHLPAGPPSRAATLAAEMPQTVDEGQA
jgi:hypothetical protein